MLKPLFLTIVLAAQPILVQEIRAEQIDTADKLATALAASGLPVGEITVLTTKTDPNRLMGRPGQYTTKVFFADTRYQAENTIEGFVTAADAKKRADQIIKIGNAAPMLFQYVYRRGKFVLRLDRSLEPEEAAAYETALIEATKTAP